MNPSGHTQSPADSIKPHELHHPRLVSSRLLTYSLAIIAGNKLYVDGGELRQMNATDSGVRASLRTFSDSFSCSHFLLFPLFL